MLNGLLSVKVVPVYETDLNPQQEMSRIIKDIAINKLKSE